MSGSLTLTGYDVNSMLDDFEGFKTLQWPKISNDDLENTEN